MTLETLIVAIHCLVALFMIVVVLVQGGNSGGVGAAFGGGGNTGGVLGTGATSFFAKLTYGAAVVFMFTSITLTVYSGQSGDLGVAERLEQQTQTDSGMAPPAEASEADGASIEPNGDE